MENQERKEFESTVVAHLAACLGKLGKSDMQCVTILHYQLDACYTDLFAHMESYRSLVGIKELESLVNVLREYCFPFFYEDDQPQSVRVNTLKEVATYLVDGLFDHYYFYGKFGTNELRFEIFQDSQQRLQILRKYLSESFLRILRLLSTARTINFDRVVRYTKLFELLVEGLAYDPQPARPTNPIQTTLGESNPDEHLSRLEKAAA